ncbi:hypothetical protein CPB84DRAFT_1850655 [Gymnopilus junonius]|uniref:Nephrocystin 3-like N-terminal domain-containing protein n=1 Tax=Gymnopilus junonius TaxID=109634 RepID=A0A9P5NHX4_GYMJU|nr:hypothetical protein CPB84DRAFT_1850655 [Gymnopilus junonius]
MISRQMNGTLITGGTFTTVNMVGGTSYDHSPTSATEKALKLLRSRIAAGAFHDSAERCDAPKCHPHTREAILNEILDWEENDCGVGAHPFLWLYGPAGSGKTSIAQTIAEILHKQGGLAASFFFGRTSVGRNDDSRLIATLAYQLTLSIPELSNDILLALSWDPAIFDKSLETQLEKLVLDGLDECNGSKAQGHVLSVLHGAVCNSHLPLSFLFASRPEHEIRNFFNQPEVNLTARRLVLDDKYRPDADIAIFLHARFEDIKSNHPSASHITSLWPSHSDIERLIRKASGQFIYVSTVMKFVESPNHWPSDRLDVIFGLTSPGTNTPFADLDALYTHILSSVGDIDRVRQIFAFLLLRESDFDADMNAIEDFLRLRRGQLDMLLKDLHSVIYVPLPSRRWESLRLFHASLGDFLLDRTRSGRFFLDPEEAHSRMARYSIRYLKYSSLLPPSEINTTVLKICHQGLMRHCSKSRPSRGLLKDLSEFDFEGYLNMPFGPYRSTLSRTDPCYALPLFSSWIHTQALQIDKYNLVQKYTSHFDRFVKSRLSQYPADPVSRHLFISSTLDPFSKHCPIVIRLLTFQGPHDTFAQYLSYDVAGCAFTYANDPKTRDYYKMVSEFLTNEGRAGIYFVDKSGYKSLAKFLVDILTSPIFVGDCPEGLTRDELRQMEECALDLLYSLLSRVPEQTDLSEYLHNNPIPSKLKYSTGMRLQSTIFAIQVYIEVMTHSGFGPFS